MILKIHIWKEIAEKKAAQLRNNNKPVTGLELTETLSKYSERGQEYVKSLNSLISYNKLSEIDEAHLSDKEIINLIPIGDSAE